MSARARCAQLCALALLALAATPLAASASVTIEPGDVTLELLDANGMPEVRAGAHPDRLVQSFKLTDVGGPAEDVKELMIDLPAGLSGNPAAVPTCPRWQIKSFAGGCPAESQVGLLGGAGSEAIPVYSVQPAPNEAAVFAARGAFSAITFIGKLRAGDQGLSLRLSDIEQSAFFELREGRMELWGIPADHQTGTAIPRKALLTTPTHCSGAPLPVGVRFRTWQQPDRWVSGGGDSGHPLSGCGDLRFEPRLEFSLDDPRADAPSGLRIDLIVPQNEDPDGRASSQVQSASIALPEGMTFSPGSAAGLRSCSDAQFGAGNDSEPSCPPASRAGAAELVSAGLEKPMKGTIYLGEERPGARFRLLMAAGAAGAEVKFVASLQPGPRSGQLTANLNDLPAASFDRLTMRFDGGAGALLATPVSCGPAKTSARISPNSGGAAVAWTGAVAVAGPGGAPCAGAAPFAPTFTGGSLDARAGRRTSFTTTVRRRDGEQLPKRLTISLPPGLSAALGRIGSCTGPQAQSASCPARSRIGKAVAELGPGGNPARLEGDVYLTGSYRQAPFGVAIVLGAALGPFDLGTLVVRAALRVDPRSGQVKVETDSLPTTFEGIPIRFQTIGFDLDRPGFVRNPTSCGRTRATATLVSESGAVATPSSPFALRGCVDLPFRPKFSVALGGKRQLHRGGKPSLRMSMRLADGSANLRSVAVALPRLLRLDANGLKELCARHKALNGDCPKSARVGSAAARTPLLKHPMKGFLYVVQPDDDGPPDLWAGLAGQGLEINLRGETAVHDGQTETKFAGLPDFPLRALRLRVASGKRGMLKLKRDPCGRLVAPTGIRGQNGAKVTVRTRVAVQSSCRRDG